MSKIAYFALVILLACVNTEAFVKKPGIKSTIPVGLIYTPYGKSHLKNFFHRIIFPGTKWCGDGDIADDYDDLGYFEETDKCCRDHDYCDDIIPAGESNHGLHNDGAYTRLHCKCDLQFFDCLLKSDCTCAGVVATSYFNILGAQCYDFKHPATCVEYDDILGMRERCVKYEYDDTKPEEWQWFDMPRYLFGPNANLDLIQ